MGAAAEQRSQIVCVVLGTLDLMEVLAQHVQLESGRKVQVALHATIVLVMLVHRHVRQQSLREPPMIVHFAHVLLDTQELGTHVQHVQRGHTKILLLDSCALLVRQALMQLAQLLFAQPVHQTHFLR